MKKQQGFTLIEIMVVIGIIAILSSIGIPTYQNYLRKAALTDMLQSFVPYRTAVELCAIEHGGLASCNAGSNGIPKAKKNRYIGDIGITRGVITLAGQESLNGLTVIFTPQWRETGDITGWVRNCNTVGDAPLKQACEEVFRFEANATGAGE